MINQVIDFSAKHRVGVVVGALLAALGGWWSIARVPLDALPDLSDTQVIVYSSWDRSPDIIEDQVTYPIVTALLGAPHVKAVRGFSDFGASYVYVVFDDGTDIYWARSRNARIPVRGTGEPAARRQDRARPGRHGSGLGVSIRARRRVGNAQPRRDALVPGLVPPVLLKAVPGVADVASLGGYVRQYQVNVDPNRLHAYGLPIGRVVDAVRGGNNDVGGRLIEFGGTEYMVRGRGYARLDSRFREHRADRERRRHARSNQGRRAGRVGARRTPRRIGSRRHGRSGVRHRRHAARRECARRDRPRARQAPGGRKPACPQA